MIAVDTETYWNAQYSVAGLGHRRYARDSRFRCLTVSAVADSGERASAPPERFPWGMLEGADVVAHNAGFDRHVLQALGRRAGAWSCTACLCAYCGLPRSLAGAVREVFGVHLDKSERDRIAAPLLTDNLEEYCTSDAEWCLKLWQKLSPEWPEAERRMAAETERMGDAGVGLDVPRAQEALAALRGQLERIEGAFPWRPVSSGKQFAAACRRNGLPVPPSTADCPETDAWVAEHAAQPEAELLRKIQQWRRTNRQAEVVASLLDRVEDGRVPYQLRYFGAVPTGRWAGSGGLNLQNLPRSVGECGVDIRSLLVPAPGTVFVVADYAQIEARVALWLAGDWEYCAELAGGGDLYEVFARRALDYSDPAPLKKANPSLRQLAKAMVLGLGFGMGAGKFVASARALGGVTLTFEEAQARVRQFRRANGKLVDLWGRLEDSFGAAVSAGRRAYTLPLPSGRRMRYWAPGYDGGMVAEQVRGEARVALHPGLVAENMVQATARDVLAAAWLRCVDAGYLPVLSVHDELVFEVPEADAEGARAEIVRLMSTQPPWENAGLLPVAVEATVAQRYGK
jgi:DNA polymerase I-like protein with 3'-5' exonuclease and polymerase domains